jgi:hypothetical protein
MMTLDEVMLVIVGVITLAAAIFALILWME